MTTEREYQSVVLGWIGLPIFAMVICIIIALLISCDDVIDPVRDELGSDTATAPGQAPLENVLIFSESPSLLGESVGIAKNLEARGGLPYTSSYSVNYGDATSSGVGGVTIDRRLQNDPASRVHVLDAQLRRVLELQNGGPLDFGDGEEAE